MITSTVSGGGDQGADPNKLVEITDNLGAATLPASESFQTVRTAVPCELFRGVAFAPTASQARGHRSSGGPQTKHQQRTQENIGLAERERPTLTGSAAFLTDRSDC